MDKVRIDLTRDTRRRLAAMGKKRETWDQLLNRLMDEWEIWIDEVSEGKWTASTVSE